MERDTASDVRERVPAPLQRAMDLAQAKGASSWLTPLPIEELGFSLHKGAFWDALALRYGWSPLNVPSHCACGVSFSIQHVLSCPKGGFPSLRHNEVRDFTATVMTEVCHDVCVEPHLQPLSGEALNGATAISTDDAQFISLLVLLNKRRVFASSPINRERLLIVFSTYKYIFFNY